ncbi:MAG: hypothetical protein KJ050_02485 [Candidatus Omnitrophica bacterium]|nr:hypothetical protein [bacterium]MBK7495662.1 hypothetical protein [Candidatus Omnitrophota bacterium]MBV6482568.1 hypothetical protein [bacterium]MCL4733776.1 hypothetical protein [Candidatus Omnitrophota bacterium]
MSSTLTSIERVANALARFPVDHIPVVVSPWGATIERWRKEGHIGQDENVAEHFGQDIHGGGWINCVADLDFQVAVIEETEETILRKDGNGATLRHHKLHDSTPEHVDFDVKERQAWEIQIKPHLLDVDPRRIPFEDYRKAKAFAAEKQRFYCWGGVAPFEQMHPVCGHEYMLMGMATDPEWVKDMVMTYAHFTLIHLEELFSKEGKPDGMWFYEDMGFKLRPFMSPSMYRDIVQPGHKLLFDYAHSLGCKVIVHSCGFIEPLVPGMVEAGMDCLQAMEVKAGMDMRRIFDHFGDRLSFFGNIDVRTLISNDLSAVESEMLSKIPYVLKNGGGYILHTDHSEPPEINYETEKFFVERGREISQLN